MEGMKGRQSSRGVIAPLGDNLSHKADCAMNIPFVPLGSVRVNPLGHAASLSHLDVSTQADIVHLATSYESEDENMGRRHNRVVSNDLAGRTAKKATTTLYSKQEFREQYCITNKQLDLFELEKSKKEKFFGCLSHYNIESPCSRTGNRPNDLHFAFPHHHVSRSDDFKRSSLLSVCVRRRVPSDENLNVDYAPIQRYPRYPPPAPPPDELYQYDEDLECSYFRRRPKSVCSQPDPKRYTWMPEDEDSTRMERPRPIRVEDEFEQRTRPSSRQSNMSGGSGMQFISYSNEFLNTPTPQHRLYQCPAHPELPPPPPPPALAQEGAPHRQKHVSFARSHTLTSFDDAATSTGSTASAPVRRLRPNDSTERLLDGRKKSDPQLQQPQQQQPMVIPIAPQPFVPPYQPVMPQVGQPFPNQIPMGHFPQGQVFSINGPVPVHGQLHPAIVTHFPPGHIVSMQSQHHMPVSHSVPVSQEDSTKVVVLEKLKRGPMKTQATQTEVCLGRKPLPPNYLSLSPRTVKRVKMVAQGVQTNGGLNGKKLLKSYSEAGAPRFDPLGQHHQSVGTTAALPVDFQQQAVPFAFSSSDSDHEHERLQRTQSEEPPRSPRPMPTPPETTPKKQVTLLDQPIIQYPPTPTSSVQISSRHSTPCSTISRRQSTPSVEQAKLLRDQAHEYFLQNLQFIHTDDRDDTIDEQSLVQDMQLIQQSMELNQKNLDYLQQKIAAQQMLKSTDPIQKTPTTPIMMGPKQKITTGQLSKTSTLQSEASISTETSGTTTTTTTDTEKMEKEIFIDFEPQLNADSPLLLRRAKKRVLQKTLSEGEILLDRRKHEIMKNAGESDLIKDAPLVMSTSHENVKVSSDVDFGNDYDYYQHTPIKDEGIFKQSLTNGIFSSTGALPTQESIDEEFHENIVCLKKGMFRKRSISLEEPSSGAGSDGQDNSAEGRAIAKSTPTSPQSDLEKGHQQLKRSKKDMSSPDDGDSVVPTSCLFPDQKASPFASSDSLTNDLTRDHSDGIWNESQATVLQVDSGTDNGTVLSTSEMSSLTATPGNLSLLTPNSRRKHLLLLQHQQRSSMDTDALDEELDYAQSPSSPRIKIDSSGITAAPSQKQHPLSPIASSSKSVPLPITKQPTSIMSKMATSPPRAMHAPSIAITKYDQSIDVPDEQTIKRTIMNSVAKRRERALSPSRRRELQKKSPGSNGKTPDLTPSHTPHRSLDSPENGKGPNAVVPDLLLARTDSGKTNTTDVSESTTTTTTDDYVTANSDSSKKSGSGKHVNQAPECKNHEGSSFESASSIYSLARVEAISEDMVVPSFSPPSHIVEESLDAVTGSIDLAAAMMSTLPKEPTTSVKVKLEKHKKRSSNASPSSRPKVSPGKDMPSPSGSSSSSGSYSLTGSTPDLGDKKKSSEKETELVKPEAQTPVVEQPVVVQRPPIPSPTLEQTVPVIKGESISEDERSGHYSSSGYYESPVEDDEDDGGLTYKYSQKYRSSSKPWTADERRRKRKNFTLDFSKSQPENVSSPPQDSWSRKSSLVTDNLSYMKTERSPLSQDRSSEEAPKPQSSMFMKKSPSFPEKNKTASSPKNQIDVEKTLRERDFEAKRIADRERFAKRKSKSRSPVQGTRKDITPIHMRSQGLLMETLRRQEMAAKNGKVQLNVLTSDDSSEQYRPEGSGTNGSVSPRRHRRPRESPRRKTGNNVLNAKSPTSGFSCGVSAHRMRKKSGSNESVSLPGSLPRRRSSIQPTKIVSSLEAEDIETSLTSAGYRLSPLTYVTASGESPGRQRMHKKGSPDTKPKAMSAESLRSVSPGSDSVFYSEAADLSGACVISTDQRSVHCHHCGKQVDIITAEDASSPHFKDEQPDIVQPPAGFADSPNGIRPATKHPSGRLYKKLEKRFRSEERQHAEKRHHHRYRQDVRAKSEERGKEELEKHDVRPMARSTGNSLDRLRAAESSPNMEGDDADDPESDFGVYADSYRSSLWIYIGDNEEMTAWQRPDRDDERNQEGDDKDPRRDSTESEHEFRKKYQAITHRMVHRKSCIEMYKRQSSNTFESDKTVIVRRESGEFGFRIHGSKPVVVSAIEPDTPAETSGLEVGDIVIAVNGINVLDKSHSEVVKIAHAGSDTLELEVARTCDVVASLTGAGTTAALYSGYLWKQAGHASGQTNQKWTRRWFCLKRDNCLYYYKTDSDLQPVGALMLIKYEVTRTTMPEQSNRPFSFRIHKEGAAGLHLAAESEEATTRWIAVISHAVEKCSQRDGWLDATIRNMKVSPSQVLRPDCFGYLMKLGNKWKSWTKRYCVLKDACLYFYQDGNSKNAFGMACLHGYRVQQSNTGGKKYAFEIMPPEPKQRHFYFHTESEMDKKRWVAALEYSIDRWMKAG